MRPALNDKQLARMQWRIQRFQRFGLSEAAAEKLADRLADRDYERDDRRVCLECSNYAQDGSCLPARQGRMPNTSRSSHPNYSHSPLPDLLQRCSFFALTNIRIDDIRLDGGTQTRTGISEATVSEYAEAVMSGAVFPAVVVFFDGTDYYLADGFHRLHGHRQAGSVEILADVRTGTRRDALLFAVGANAEHGLRRTNDDKRKAVRILLEDAEWCQWGDREIARRAGVGYTLVASVRAQMAPSLPATGSENGSLPATTEPGADSDGPSAAELLDELQRENEQLQATVKAAEADDAKAEVIKWKRVADAAQRGQSEAMERAAKAVERESWTMRQLRRCGKAVGEDNPENIAAKVEAMARAARKVAA
jgi:hypothetical protein